MSAAVIKSVRSELCRGMPRQAHSVHSCQRYRSRFFTTSFVVVIGRSGQDSLDQLRLDYAGQLLIHPAVKVSQLAVVESHQMQDRRVEIADVVATHDRLVSKFVGFAVRRAAFDTRPRHEISEAFGIMIASAATTLHDRLAAELA